MSNVMKELFDIVQERRRSPQENSYTCYLFEKGLDKILKKVGEECSETIIAAKNGDNDAIVMEICDLLYHLLVMMSCADIKWAEVEDELFKRRAKIGNLKSMRSTDHVT